MNTVKNVLTHVHTQAKIIQLKKEYNEKLQALDFELATALLNDGYDLTVKECALVLGYKEMTIRAYLNPKMNKLSVSYKHGKTYILNESVKSQLLQKNNSAK